MDPSASFSESKNSAISTVIVDEKYYKIVEEDNFKYHYYIYDFDKNVIDEQSFDNRCPSIDFINDNTVDIHMGMGTGVIWHKYYSVKRDCFSKVYWYVVAYDQELIAYINTTDRSDEKSTFEDRRLVVRNAFDKSILYKEFDLDFSEEIMPITEAMFVNDGAQLQITYLKGKNRETITEIFDLS